jgi:hypothetical protein
MSGMGDLERPWSTVAAAVQIGLRHRVGLQRRLVVLGVDEDDFQSGIGRLHGAATGAATRPAAPPAAKCRGQIRGDLKDFEGELVGARRFC